MSNRIGSGPESERLRSNRIIDALAGRQHGVVSRSQLREAGLGRSALDRRVKAGRLRPLHRGVYLVGPLDGPRARVMAAVLACGEGGVAAGETGAWLRGWWPAPGPPFRVIVPGRDPRPGGEVRVHRTAALPADERDEIDGIPTTTGARTLLDVGATLPPRDLERMVARALDDSSVDERDLRTLLRRHPRHRGAATLRALLGAGASLTRSEAEVRFLALMRAAHVAEPDTNVRIAGHEVDFVWRKPKVVVEVDGFRYHRSRSRFERASTRDAELSALGYRVLHVTWKQITEEAVALAVRVGQTLALAGTR